MPRGEGGGGGALRLDALEVALSRELPGAEGQETSPLLKALAQGIQVVVQDHLNAQADILRQAGPEEDKAADPNGHLSPQPQGMDPRPPEHPEIQAQVNGRHPQVTGDKIQKAA